MSKENTLPDMIPVAHLLGVVDLVKTPKAKDLILNMSGIRRVDKPKATHETGVSRISSGGWETCVPRALVLKAIHDGTIALRTKDAAETLPRRKGAGSRKEEVAAQEAVERLRLLQGDPEEFVKRYSLEERGDKSPKR